MKTHMGDSPGESECVKQKKQQQEMRKIVIKVI